MLLLPQPKPSGRTGGTRDHRCFSIPAEVSRPSMNEWPMGGTAQQRYLEIPYQIFLAKTFRGVM
jgi:hypothetical protein